MATITNHLKLDWKIDISPAAFYGGPNGMIGGQPGKDTRALTSRNYWSSYFNPEASLLITILPTDGTRVTATVQTKSFGNQGLVRHFVGDYYYRIWVVPRTLVVTNPVLGLAYTFNIWSAYPGQTNSLTTVGGTGQTGLTLNFTPPDAYGELEFKEASITIDASAPIEVDADYIFTFTTGEGLFNFVTSLARFLEVAPEPPVTETWEFYTDVMRAWDSTEKRIQLREDPRIGQRFTLTLEDDEDRRIQYNQWYKSMPSDIVIPYAAYSTNLTQDVTAGATKLYFDPSRTDLRDDDFLVLLDPATETGELATIDTVDADGATLNAGVTQNFTTRTLVCPGHRSRLANPSGLAMNALHGSMQVNSSALAPRSPLSRPGSVGVINTFTGYNVLDKRPLADSPVQDTFDAGTEVIDNKTGVQDVVTAWTHPFVGGKRVYLIQRFFQPEEMDFWRDFISATKGQQNPFLLPSYRDDLTKSEDPPDGSPYIDITNSDYEAQYFPYETYKRIQIVTTGAGTIWREITAVVDNGDGTWQLSLDTALPTGFGSITQISFLNLVRLASDKVTLTHGHVISRMEINVRTIDA